MSAPVDLSILAGVLREYDRNTCTHEETHRGGAIWTICDGCGMKWADDRGGFEPYQEPESIAAARALLDGASPACADPVVETNVALLRLRSAVGIAKYGTTVAGNKLPLRAWLNHALEETLDNANYLQRAMQEIDAAPAPATPAASVDTAEFRELAQTYAVNFGNGYYRRPFIDYIDAHTASAVADGVIRGWNDAWSVAQKEIDELKAQKAGTESMFYQMKAERDLLLAAAPQQHAQAAQQECLTCSGHGLIGGLLQGDGGYHSEDCPACDGTGHAQAALSDAQREGLKVIDDLMSSITKHGNYSQEATLTFLSQIRQCFAASQQPAAAPGLQHVALSDVEALAWKWHRDAVKDGFACSEPAQELFELLGWPSDPAAATSPVQREVKS